MMKGPLLVAYLLKGFQSLGDPPKRESDKGGLVLPALGLHFPGTSDPESPRHLVRYRLNRVAQRELMPFDVDDEMDTSDEDRDD